MELQRIISIHGAAGAGKSTLLKMIGEYFRDGNCIILYEIIDHLWRTKSYRRRRSSFHILSTTMTASKKIVRTTRHILILIFFLLLCSIYSIISKDRSPAIMAIFALSIPFLCQLMASHLLSKLWNYYSDQYIKSKEEEATPHSLDINNNSNNVRWTWFDRNCVDIYGFCCIDQPMVVPTDFIEVLNRQTADTSVAIIMDTPRKIICRHLAARFCGQDSSRITRLVTKLLIKIPFMIQTTLKALHYVEEWYYAFNVPVIKVSQLYEQLDKDNETEEIIWTKNSVEILLKEIEKSIAHKHPVTEQQEQAQKQLLLPWLTKIRDSDHVH